MAKVSLQNTGTGSPGEAIGHQQLDPMGSNCFSREVHKAQRARRHIVYLSLHLQPHFVYASRKDPGELHSSYSLRCSTMRYCKSGNFCENSFFANSVKRPTKLDFSVFHIDFRR